MGSFGNLKNKIKTATQEKYEMNPDMAYKLFKARDKAFFKALEQLGVDDHGLRDSDGNINQTALWRRMDLAGVKIVQVKEHPDPRDNGIVFFKHGKAEIGITQPFIEKGKIVVRFIEPALLIKGVA